MVGQDLPKGKVLPVHTHTPLHSQYFKVWMWGRLNSIRHENRYLIGLHFYTGKDLTDVTHSQDTHA